MPVVFLGIRAVKGPKLLASGGYLEWGKLRKQTKPVLCSFQSSRNAQWPKGDSLFLFGWVILSDVLCRSFLGVKAWRRLRRGKLVEGICSSALSGSWPAESGGTRESALTLSGWWGPGAAGRQGGRGPKRREAVLTLACRCLWLRTFFFFFFLIYLYYY